MQQLYAYAGIKQNSSKIRVSKQNFEQNFEQNERILPDIL